MTRCRLAGLVIVLGLVAPGAFGQGPDLAAIAELLRAGQLESAERELRSHLARGENPVVWDLLGVTLGQQERRAEAEEAFRRAVALDSTFQPAWQHLARVLLLSGREGEAVEVLRTAAELGDLERDLALKLGTVEIAADRTPSAERQLLSLADRFDSVQALLYLDRLRASAGDLEGALEVLERAVDIAPSSEEVLATLARRYLEAQRTVEALLTLEPLVRLYPSVAEYQYLMGVVRLQLGDPAGAVEALERSREAAPGRVLTLLTLGLALNEQTRYAEAATVLEQCLRLAPDQVEALAALAEAEEGQARLDSAERYAERALSLAPDHAASALVLGMVRLEQERYEEARDLLVRSVEADPGSPKAHYQLSLAYARLQDPVNSKKHRELYRQTLRALQEKSNPAAARILAPREETP